MITEKYDNLEFLFIEIEPFEKVNAEDYVSKLFKGLGFDVKKNNRIIGMPDFIVKNYGREFYLEVKTGKDGLRAEQVEWIRNNPNKSVIVIFVKQSSQTKKREKIVKQKQKKLEEREELKKLSIEAQNSL